MPKRSRLKRTIKLDAWGGRVPAVGDVVTLASDKKEYVVVKKGKKSFLIQRVEGRKRKPFEPLDTFGLGAGLGI